MFLSDNPDYNYYPYCGKALKREPNLPAQEVISSVGMKLRYIKAGEFVMASPVGEARCNLTA